MEEERLYDVYALDEDIEILKEMTFIFDNIGVGSLLNESQYIGIKRLIAMNEHLIEAYRILKDKVNEMEMISKGQDLVIKGSIPKSKVKEKIDSKFKEAKGLYERGAQPQAQFTMKLLKDLEKELLEEE